MLLFINNPYVHPRDIKIENLECAQELDPMLLTPLLTNIGSGIYEWYRYEKEKMKKRI